MTHIQQKVYYQIDVPETQVKNWNENKKLKMKGMTIIKSGSQELLARMDYSVKIEEQG